MKAKIHCQTPHTYRTKTECRFFLYAWGGTVDGESIGYHSQRVASSERVCLPNSTVCPGEPILSVSMKITHLHVVYVLIRWSYVSFNTILSTCMFAFTYLDRPYTGKLYSTLYGTAHCIYTANLNPFRPSQQKLSKFFTFPEKIKNYILITFLRAPSTASTWMGRRGGRGGREGGRGIALPQASALQYLELTAIL